MNLLFFCRFLGQVTLITNPHKNEDLDHQNNDVGNKGEASKQLETLYIHVGPTAFDQQIISTC